MDDPEAQEAVWPKALTHPLRARILRHLLDATTASPTAVVSPASLARAWDQNVAVISYHLRRLRELGLVELASQVPVRGAIEHRYRLRDLTATAEALWRAGAPRPARRPVAQREQAAQAASARVQSAVARLRHRRKERGLSQAELARRIGQRPSSVGQIERGKVDPPITILFALADALEYPLGELFADATTGR